MWTTIAASTVLASLLLGAAHLVGKVRLGPILGRWRLPPVRLRPDDEHRFGPVGSTRTAVVVDLDGAAGEALAGAGRIAATTWFPDETRALPRGVAAPEVAVLVATGRPRGGGRRGAFAEPDSRWHGVLFGLVEVAVPGNRPHFGRDAAGHLDGEALARLLGALYANVAAYLYGVPLGALAPYRPSTPGSLGVGSVGRAAIAGRPCDAVTVTRLVVPSPAVASGDPARLAAPDPLLGRAVRWALGTAPPSRRLGASFPAVPLALRILVENSVRRDLDRGEQKVTTLLVTAAHAEGDAEEGEALRAAQERALVDLLERVEREREEDGETRA